VVGVEEKESFAHTRVTEIYTHKRQKAHWAWWCISIVPAIQKRLKLEDHLSSGF
jgi:hypothetical protein